MISGLFSSGIFSLSMAEVLAFSYIPPTLITKSLKQTTGVLELPFKNLPDSHRQPTCPSKFKLVLSLIIGITSEKAFNGCYLKPINF